MKTYWRTIITFLVSAIFMVSCSNQEQDMLNDIAALENKIAQFDGDDLPDKDLVMDLVEAYDNFAQAFPEHAQTPDFLFEAGRYCMSYNEPHKAVAFFERIVNNYPDYEKHPDSYFLKAFVYDSKLNNIPQARLNYEKFIEMYPDHEMANEASLLIDLLGRSLDDIIADFERMNLEDAHEDSESSDYTED